MMRRKPRCDVWREDCLRTQRREMISGLQPQVLHPVAGRAVAAALGGKDIRVLLLSLMTRSQQKELVLLLPPPGWMLVPGWMLMITLRHLERWLQGLLLFLRTGEDSLKTKLQTSRPSMRAGGVCQLT